jgi:hypothetical protein
VLACLVLVNALVCVRTAYRVRRACLTLELAFTQMMQDFKDEKTLHRR